MKKKNTQLNYKHLMFLPKHSRWANVFSYTYAHNAKGNSSMKDVDKSLELGVLQFCFPPFLFRWNSVRYVLLREGRHQPTGSSRTPVDSPCNLWMISPMRVWPSRLHVGAFALEFLIFHYGGFNCCYFASNNLKERDECYPYCTLVFT